MVYSPVFLSCWMFDFCWCYLNEPAMAKGISIHIGLNRVNRKVYGSPCTLNWCVNDAIAMRNLAAEIGYDWLLLLNSRATKKRVLQALNIAACYLNEEDILFLSYSGHGDQRNDKNRDEETDHKDEAWALFDGCLLDDVLFEYWKKFKPGTRIIVISDSCHSGTMLKNDNQIVLQDDYERLNPNSIWLERWQDLVSDNLCQGPDSASDSIQASVMLLAACAEREVVAANGNSCYSLFTEQLLKVWDRGRFNGNYETFLNKIAAKMPMFYHPQISTEGQKAKTFKRQKPFSIY